MMKFILLATILLQSAYATYRPKTMVGFQIVKLNKSASSRIQRLAFEQNLEIVEDVITYGLHYSTSPEEFISYLPTYRKFQQSEQHREILQKLLKKYIEHYFHLALKAEDFFTIYHHNYVDSDLKELILRQSLYNMQSGDDVYQVLMHLYDFTKKETPWFQLSREFVKNNLSFMFSKGIENFQEKHAYSKLRGLRTQLFIMGLPHKKTFSDSLSHIIKYANSHNSSKAILQATILNNMGHLLSLRPSVAEVRKALNFLERESDAHYELAKYVAWRDLRRSQFETFPFPKDWKNDESLKSAIEYQLIKHPTWKVPETKLTRAFKRCLVAIKRLGKIINQ